MTAVAATLRADAKVIGLVSAAHMLSHFALLVVPSLFYLMTEEFGVGFAALGLAMSMLSVMSGLFQTAGGFLVDRFGGKRVLIGGMAIISSGLVLVGLAPSYPMLVLALMVTGLGNSAFHPADFAILNAKVDAQRLGYAFSVHGVSGNIGFALAPLFAVSLGALIGWRQALLAAGVIGLALTGLIAKQRSLHTEGHSPGARRDSGGARESANLLLSLPVLSCLAFFTFSAIATVGLQVFAIPTIVSLYGVAPVAASATLTGYLVGAAAGTLIGGFVAARVNSHGAVAISGILSAMGCVLVLGTGAVPLGVLAVVMTMAGFCLGIAYPSRDIIVRQTTPAHARGKVYGFVYSGLDLGSAIGPPVLGWFLDRGEPKIAFYASAASLLLGALTMFFLRSRRA